MKAAAVAINDDWPKGLHEVFGHFISSEPLSCRTGEELFPGLYEAVVRRRSREGFHAIVTELGVYLAQSHPAAYARWNGQRSEEHTSELQSLIRISYPLSCSKQ